jgi:hypothetical protein
MVGDLSIEMKLIPDPKINNGEALLSLLDNYNLVNYFHYF